jgi:peptidoglycan/xylan/chitin deacetylase (PgdA/CDA1 family)
MPRTPARSFLVVLLALCVVLAGSILFFVPHGSSAAIDSVRSTLGFDAPPEPEMDRDSERPELPAVADIPAATPTAPAAASDDPCAPGAAEASANQGRAVYVITETLQFRSGPGLDCPVVASLPFGQMLELAGRPVTRDGIIWRSVQVNGQAGYVASGAVRTKDAQATRTAEIPILMYHLIDDSGGRFVTTPDQLHAQMAWLRDNGYTSITPSNLYEAIYNDLPLPDKPVMITVDDGYSSDLLFAEIVTSYGFRPVFFWPNYAELSQDEMQYLASLGEACGHTVSHAALSQLSWEGQYAELAPNKTWIEEQLGYPIRCFAYPFGAYNGMTTDVVRHVGYDIAFDAWGAVSIVGLVDPIHISRKEIEGTFDLETFAAIMIHGYT